ncbi:MULTISPECIES: bifunctional 4-hydroxy-2-oxoglutarate aldolase/2-dehydro-3-deoxy-phosphogluconate aldolase [unclassified Rathayibacter]|uniref:bifunctional 4-hydroxy-2-oxoglutarate aldolase/2-dehydro-3-deoxy-phosphogluconate aldolase n=1 Tax=unclassified Rathayibacter TaxID=2609250 RepID=UPI0020B14261|nr:MULTISPECIES: bifunctional 4-hydroxy-2-oxoglutarate aldolase/2-dehydro-3-deoxy-phosphogluconate aldolase [unclassified Rathayibacter]
MSGQEVLDALATIRVLPVVVIDDPADAAPLARALVEGGVPCAEVTLRTPDADRCLAAMVAMPGFMAGCGTVLSAAQVDAACDAGAAFLVSPGFSEEIAERAERRGVVLIPGVASATEVMRARSTGLRVLKLFPASSLGGAATIAALRGPFPDVAFVPSGGVSLVEAPSYRIGGVQTVSTSWIAPRSDIASGRFDDIAERARAFRDAVAP